MFEERLIEILEHRNVSSKIIKDVINSGYIIRNFGNLFGKTWESVSDKMFGNKQLSSMFDIDEFIEYISGKYEFPELPIFTQQKIVKNIKDIQEFLLDDRRQHYIKQGLLSY